MMWKTAKLLCLLHFILLISCQTGTCPNCVNPKPDYYNASRAKEARRMSRHSTKTTATGQTVDFEPAGQEQKEKAVRHKHRKSKNETVNDPIL